MTAGAAVGPWIAKLLEADLATRAVLALRAAKTVGQRTAFSVLGDMLAEALEQHGSATIARSLDQEGILTQPCRCSAWRAGAAGCCSTGSSGLAGCHRRRQPSFPAISARSLFLRS